MTGFMIRFLIDNLFISIIIVILSIIKRLPKNNLTSRMRYNLWFPLFGLLSVPFIPLPSSSFSNILLWLAKLKHISVSGKENVSNQATDINISKVTNQVNEFVVSVSDETPSIIWLILFTMWIVGILAIIIFVIRAYLRLNTLKKSSLPLQSEEILQLYKNCLNELNITTDIPIYSTAYIKSPVMIGLFKSCVYLPLHLISDYYTTDTQHIPHTKMQYISDAEIRYILLHELHHYKYKDALVTYLMNIVHALYWFNPFVWYVLKEMCIEKEMACDASVLKMLKADDYEKYGNTLLNFAEKVSPAPFTFVTGISGDMKQMQRRIINIASYKNPTFSTKMKSIAAFILITLLLLCFVPTLSTHAADENHYNWNTVSKDVSCIDLSSYFGEYNGSFVLYDLEDDAWKIYNMEQASLRVAPNSTYKIYDALFGLEENVITPEDSFIAWDNEIYPFESWNVDQTLQSAMSNSVNWYFQTIDEHLGEAVINSYLQEIGYGNKNSGKNISSYWLESTLKISPIEQVELLSKFYKNSFDFAPENINAVKDYIRLSSSGSGDLYGKTGTGRVNDKDVNGWFVGYLETAESVYFFATNISAKDNANGNNAIEITSSILSEPGINIH